MLLLRGGFGGRRLVPSTFPGRRLDHLLLCVVVVIVVGHSDVDVDVLVAVVLVVLNLLLPLSHR